MKRRNFLRAAVVGAGVTAFGNTLTPGALAAPAQRGTGPYGPLLPADSNGIQLPAGFGSRIVARSLRFVHGHLWHPAPDGGAVFADGDGWIYVSNSEVPLVGGAGALKFNPDGTIEDGYRILTGTNLNCAGGAMPWQTWLSCEEIPWGAVWETDPWGGPPRRRPAMGLFKHEAAAADPGRRVVYLTEDESDGCFYRFVPDDWGDLSSGTLQVLVAGEATSGTFEWVDVPDPDGFLRPTRKQVDAAKRFDGGEGLHYANDTAWFTTKGDNRVWQLNLREGTYELAYDDDLVADGNPPLTGVDNITGSASGDLFVAEDGGNMEICVITPDDVVAPFLRIVGHEESEITGPAFSPAGDRLYFSSQRGTSGDRAGTGGITYEVWGPFRS